MKLSFLVFLAFINSGVNWFGNFQEAQSAARVSHKFILINFSGSDWCGPCIRLRKEILESKTFEDFALSHLLLVRADFPRLKKNQPSKEQLRLNEALAEQFNPDGKFPYTLLVDANGKVIKVWDGFPGGTPEKFVGEINAVTHDSK